ncbi:MAG: hypothetical protein ACJAYP_000209 [Flavobacterium sp.]|jgi:hypothetical protein
MKSKKSIYILLPLVLGIWGMIAFQFFSYSSNDAQQVNTNMPLVSNVNYKMPDSIIIDVNYRDPFTGTLSSTNRKAIKTNVSAKSSSLNLQSKVKDELQITYKGLVSDTSDKNKVFMVLISGKTYLMKKGQTEENVQLVKGNRSSIVVKVEGKQKTIALIE